MTKQSMKSLRWVNKKTNKKQNKSEKNYKNN